MWWQSGEPKRLKRLNDLIRDTLRTPFTGIGKPKALKGDLRGCWARRTDDEHRLVYEVGDDTLYIIQCRYHY